MQPIFCLQYGEYLVSSYLHEKKVSVFIPLSSQEKGIDLIIYNKFNNNKNKYKTIQVKSARDFVNSSEKLDNKKFFHTSMFNKIEVNPNADWYILIILYSKEAKNMKAKHKKWVPMMLAFKNREMKQLMGKLRLKKHNKPDTRFYIGFNNPDEPYLVRGLPEIKKLDKFLIKNRINEIIKF